MQEKIKLAIQKINIGNFAEAECIYLELLDQHPNDPILEHLHSQVAGAFNAEQNGTHSQKKLLNSFKNQQLHYLSVPEYNLNWSLKDTDAIKSFLNENPLNVLDIGARDAYLGEIENLKQFINYYGFDADENECNRANSNPPEGFNKFKMIPHYIGNDNPSIPFYLYKSLGDSSKYLPNQRFIDKFNTGFGVQEIVDVRSRNLKNIIKDEQIRGVDFLKIDTQGSELEILKSAKNCLSKVMLVEAEVEFTEMYDGQPLIGEFVNYMNQQGFEILYLNRVFQTRQNYPGVARGQITFSDILFSKKEDFYDDFTDIDLAKHVILLSNYGHLDIAHEIWSGYERVRNLIPLFYSHFTPYPDDQKKRQFMNGDKLLCWQLHNRRTNQFHYDSDRSWPIR
jgi:FkbM family methyltransferase